MRIIIFFLIVAIFLPIVNADATRYPIITIHGHHGSPDDFDDMMEALEEDGIAEAIEETIYGNSSTRICPIGWPKEITVKFEYYEGVDLDYYEYAERLAKASILVKQCTGSSKVNIIAHSVGGLVAREYMRSFGESNVGNVIMLETPHYGMPFDNEGDDYIRDLNTNPDECRYRGQMYNIGSKNMFEFLFLWKIRREARHDVCRNIESIAVPVESSALIGATNVEGIGCKHSGTGTSIIKPRCEWAYEYVTEFVS
ncbi:esterase/lipase family protein [Nanoarchaeota archaeon]